MSKYSTGLVEFFSNEKLNRGLLGVWTYNKEERRGAVLNKASYFQLMISGSSLPVETFPGAHPMTTLSERSVANII